jgi:hypothetical protein
MFADFFKIENGATQGKEGDQGGGSGVPGTSGGCFYSVLYALFTTLQCIPRMLFSLFELCTTSQLKTGALDPSFCIWPLNYIFCLFMYSSALPVLV